MGGEGGIDSMVATLYSVKLAVMGMLVREPAKTTKLENEPTAVGLTM